MPTCAHCGKPYELVERARFDDRCPSCGGAIHACVNCRLYRPGSYNDCASHTTEPVPDKHRANRCEEFHPAEAPPRPRKKAASWEELFRKDL